MKLRTPMGDVMDAVIAQQKELLLQLNEKIPKMEEEMNKARTLRENARYALAILQAVKEMGDRDLPEQPVTPVVPKIEEEEKPPEPAAEEPEEEKTPPKE